MDRRANLSAQASRTVVNCPKVTIAFGILPVFNSFALTPETLRTVVCAKPPNVNVTDEGSHAMSNKSRHRRTADQRRRRWRVTGTGVAIAVGGAVAAAFASTGTASADDLVGPAAGADAVTSLAQTIDPNTSAAVADIAGAASAAAVPAQATFDNWDQLVLDIDPDAFNTTTGAPTDFLGDFAVQIETDLLDLPAPSTGPTYDSELNTIAGQVICADNTTCEPTLVITPPTTGDDGFTTLEQFVANTYIPEAVPAVLAPTLDTDLATIAGDLDAYFADTAFGPEIYTIAEQIISDLTAAAG
jgi:hypothetical protein